MSWMNQSGQYHPELNAIICSSITPYQKFHEYDKIKTLKDKTFFIAESKPTSWEVNQSVFEGEGGLAYPFRFLFGAAKTEKEVTEIRNRYFQEKENFEAIYNEYSQYVSEGQGCIEIKTPDTELDNFINHWLPRQIYYHGETNRLSTDPQTRNYLQDSMGMTYIKPKSTRQVFIKALSQQKESGEMPDGILLYPEAELKFINQVPHTDHCVWLPVCLKAYLDETNDYTILNEMVPFEGNRKTATVAEHIHMAMRWLLKHRDHRGLNYNIDDYSIAKEFGNHIESLNISVNTHLWDGNWYARGITDDNVVFGIQTDPEGRIFLNPQAWSLLSDAADEEKIVQIVNSVEKNLESPYGVEMLAPSYTAMREDVGRVTQKHAGSAENGSIYNHAASFYVYGLYSKEVNEKAYELLRKMIPGPSKEDILQRGQLPVFIPNYYRGAYIDFQKNGLKLL